jgi:hypothetical protein
VVKKVSLASFAPFAIFAVKGFSAADPACPQRLKKQINRP